MSSDDSYGRTHAADYDAVFGARDDVARVADVLHAIGGDGDALEFGIGTGRLAIPLAERGRRVFGIDISPAMLDRLRAKLADRPDLAVIPVLGTFSQLRVPGRFTLVFCAFSTLFLPTTQEEQLAAIVNAAAHLEPGGRLLVEMFVHDRTRFARSQETVVDALGDDRAVLKLAKLEPNHQLIHTRKVTLTPAGHEFVPNTLRFVYPSELDLMARIAGLRPIRRWSDWRRSPFGADSAELIAVYEKPSAGAVQPERAADS